MYEPNPTSEMFQQLISTVPASRLAAGYLHCVKEPELCRSAQYPCGLTLPQRLAVLRNHSECIGYDRRAEAQSP